MNKYSYKKENQDAFGVWFDSIPSDKKQEYLDLLKAEDFGQWAYDALKAGNQEAGWCDSFHDSLFVWGGELEDDLQEVNIQFGTSYYALAVRDNALGEFYLQENPALTRKELNAAKLAFKRALGGHQYKTEKQAQQALARLPDSKFVYVAEVTPVYGIL